MMSLMGFKTQEDENHTEIEAAAETIEETPNGRLASEPSESRGEIWAGLV
jgi:hypothetical protein